MKNFTLIKGLMMIAALLAFTPLANAEFTNSTHYYSNFTIDNNLSRSIGVNDSFHNLYGLILQPNLCGFDGNYAVGGSDLSRNASNQSYATPSWQSPGLNDSLGGTVNISGTIYTAATQYFNGDTATGNVIGPGVNGYVWNSYQTNVWVNGISIVMNWYSGGGQSCAAALVLTPSFLNGSVYSTVAGVNYTASNTTINYDSTYADGLYRFDYVFTPVYTNNTQLQFQTGGSAGSCDVREIVWQKANFSTTAGIYYSNIIDSTPNMAQVSLNSNNQLFSGTSLIYNISCDGQPDRTSNVSSAFVTCSPSGQQLLTKIAIKSDGNSTPFLYNFSIDTIPAGTNVSTPLLQYQDPMYVGHQVNVSVILLDSGAGASADLYIRLIQNATNTSNITKVASVGNGTIASLNYTMNQSGYYLVEAYANDTTGLISDKRNSSYFLVNNSILSVSLSVPANNNVTNETPVRCVWTVSDNDTTDSFTYYFMWQGKRNTTLLVDANFTFNSPGVLNGTYNWSVEGSDGYGFVNSTTIRNITLDDLPPEITSILNYSTSVSTITINYTVNETNRIKINYGPSLGDLGSTLTNDTYIASGARQTIISGLIADTAYYYCIYAYDVFGHMTNTTVIATATKASGTGGAGGAGGGTVIIMQQIYNGTIIVPKKGFTITTDRGANEFVIYLQENGARKTVILLSNKENKQVIVNLSCEGSDTELCAGVQISKSVVVLDVGAKDVEVPITIAIGESLLKERIVAVIGVDQDKNTGVVAYKVKVSALGSIFELFSSFMDPIRIPNPLKSGTILRVPVLAFFMIAFIMMASFSVITGSLFQIKWLGLKYSLLLSFVLSIAGTVIAYKLI